MKRNSIVLILLTLCLLLASCGYVSNKVDTDIECLVFEACLSELEDRLSSEYQLKYFKLIRFRPLRQQRRICFMGQIL